MDLTGRFYQLDSHVRHYAWGMRRHGEQLPYIADLLGEEPGRNIPWAELWIGAHPSLSSEVRLPGGGTERLDQVLAAHGSAAVGELPAGQPAAALPFLLKVLSCERALSIQSHPDKATAERLHELQPSHYPDGNHKPEVMIGLTKFEAMAGFRPLAAVLADLNGLSAVAPWRQIWEEANEVTMRVLCETLLNLPGSVARAMLVNLRRELLARGEAQSDADRLCLLLQEQNPCDRGVMFAYLLNHICLAPGEALYIPANEPHAYLCGTGIECMANSDNVIRAGLTPKHIDIRALLSTLNFNPWDIALSGGERLADGERLYAVPASEFQVSVFADGATVDLSRRRAVAGLFLVVDGSYEFADAAGGTVTAARGTTWFRPACLRAGTVRPLEKGSRLALAEVGQAAGPGARQ